MPVSTIIAQATPPGYGAVAILRMSGPQAIAIAQQVCRTELEQTSRRLCKLYTRDGQLIDQALVLLFRGPHSFSGEDTAEFQTHGNPLIIQKLIDTCLFYGAELAQPGEFSQRAYLNGKMNLADAENLLDLISAKSQLLLNKSTEQLSGNWQASISKLQEQILTTLAHLQAELDFPLDTEAEFEAEKQGNQELAQNIESFKEQIQKLLGSARASNILRQGVRCMILGRPNVGKSSFLNMLLAQERAIISAVPGTTRDYIREELLLGDIPLQLYDTAGLHEDTTDQIERRGMQRSLELATQAELVFFLVEAHTYPTTEDKTLLGKMHQLAPQSKVLLLANKSDLLPPNAPGHTDIDLYMSCLQADHTDKLAQKVQEILGISDLQADFIYSIPQRQAACLHQAYDQLAGCPPEPELASVALQAAWQHLEDIAGNKQLSSEQILDQVFGNFCIGK